MIIRKQKDSQNPYTMINNWCLRDPMLSAKAKGIFAYIMSLPDDWRFYASELEQHFTDGREAISNGLKELEKAGYLRREAIRDNGRFKSLDYTFFETPEHDKPETAFPHTAIPKSENRPILNTDLNELLKETNKESDLGKSSSMSTSSEESKTEEKEKPKQDTLPAEAEAAKSLWNDSFPPEIVRIRTMTRKRVLGLSRRVSEGMDLSKILNKAQYSDFLRGKNDRGWKMDFDWLISNDTNWVKVMEGKYDNKPSHNKRTADMAIYQ